MNQQNTHSDYDLITAAWPMPTGVEPQANGFLYLKDSRLVFITEKETIFDVNMSGVESASFVLSGSIGLRNLGKKYRVFLYPVEDLSPGSIAFSASKLLPILPVSQNYITTLESDNPRARVAKWKKQFKSYPYIKIRTGGDRVFTAVVLTLIFSLLAFLIILFIISTLQTFNSFQVMGPSVFVVPLLSFIPIAIATFFIKRWFKKK